MQTWAGWSAAHVASAEASSSLQIAEQQPTELAQSLIRALYHQIRRAAQEMLRDGTFSFARTQIPQSELNRIFESKR